MPLSLISERVVPVRELDRNRSVWQLTNTHGSRPRAGAWIETLISAPVCHKTSRSPCGAWIETLDESICHFANVAPERERDETNRAQAEIRASKVDPRAGAWMKLPRRTHDSPKAQVAPRAGAWIEPILDDIKATLNLVAPRAGAWIETNPNSSMLLI